MGGKSGKVGSDWGQRGKEVEKRKEKREGIKDSYSTPISGVIKVQRRTTTVITLIIRTKLILVFEFYGIQ